MRPVNLKNYNPENLETNYTSRIVHLSSNTVYKYRGQPMIPNGDNTPTVDPGEVCCWVSEQPLTQGMAMCCIADGNGNIKLIAEKEDEEDEDIDIDLGDDTPAYYITVSQCNLKNTLLLSKDTYEALRLSLDYFTRAGQNQTLIKDPSNPDNNVRAPFSYKHYIWPNFKYFWNTQQSSGEAMPVENEYHPNGNEVLYTCEDCFIYVERVALVHNFVANESTEENAPAFIETNPGSQRAIFIEANPNLPEPLFVMAQNTIRLFRLNGRNYVHAQRNFHSLQYNLSAAETYYDDMRLACRTELYDLAITAVDQLKTLRTLTVDQSIIDMFKTQFRMQIDVGGFRSVWIQAFHDGDDPGAIADILGVPAPSAPIEEIDLDEEVDPGNNVDDPIVPVEQLRSNASKKRTFIDMMSPDSLDQFAQSVVDFSIDIDWQTYHDNADSLLSDTDSYDTEDTNSSPDISSEPPTKKRKLNTVKNDKQEEFIQQLFVNVFTKSGASYDPPQKFSNWNVTLGFISEEIT